LTFPYSTHKPIGPNHAIFITLYLSCSFPLFSHNKILMSWVLKLIDYFNFENRQSNELLWSHIGILLTALIDLPPLFLIFLPFFFDLCLRHLNLFLGVIQIIFFYVKIGNQGSFVVPQRYFVDGTD
jgi:hypothetical protein